MEFNFDKEKVRETVNKLKFAASIGAAMLAGKAQETLTNIKARVEALSDADGAIDALLSEKARLLVQGGMKEEDAKKNLTKQIKEKIDNIFTKGEVK